MGWKTQQGNAENSRRRGLQMARIYNVPRTVSRQDFGMAVLRAR